MPVVDETTFQSTRPGRFLRRRRGLGTQEHHLGGRARAPGGDLHSQSLPGRAGYRPAAGSAEPDQPEDGDQRVELSQRLQSRRRARRCSTSIWSRRFEQLNVEVELGFYRRADCARSAALSELRYRNGLHSQNRCIECDACIDICPVQCLTITRDGDEVRFAEETFGAGHQSRSGDLRVEPAAANRTRHGEGRRRLRSLRPVRRTLPHGGLGHAEI